MAEEFAPPPAMKPLESRQWSCGTLLEGLTAVVGDCTADLPDDLAQLEDMLSITVLCVCSSGLNRLIPNLLD